MQRLLYREDLDTSFVKNLNYSKARRSSKKKTSAKIFNRSSTDRRLSINLL